MNRVRGGDRVHPPREQLAAQHLLEALEPLVRLEPPQAPECHPVVIAELVERHPQELRRAVDDHDGEAPVEHAELEAIEEDAGAARIVDQDLAAGEMPREVLDGGIEVAIPAVILDRVVEIGRASCRERV